MTLNYFLSSLYNNEKSFERARLLTGLFTFRSYRAFLLGAAFFCAELFFFVGLFFRGLAFCFGEAFIQLNLRLVNYLLMAAGYFLPIFAGCPFRNDNCKDMPIMVLFPVFLLMR